MLPTTSFARSLASAAECHTSAQLAESWFDQTAFFLLAWPHRKVPAGLGAHLRRSFLGALSQGASDAARTGQACAWDPPCALDVFCREQLRDGRGNGLPKPFIVFHTPHPDGLLVGLRVFGAANDWFMRAAEGFAFGLQQILPWERVARCDVPCLLGRDVVFAGGVDLPSVPTRVTMQFATPLDAGGRDLGGDPAGLVGRLVTRVSRMAMWSGVTLAPDLSRALSQHGRALQVDLSGMRGGQVHSPNRHRQSRQRNVLSGRAVIAGDLAPIWPLLVLGGRCSLGRGAVEGLGRYSLEL